jgi:hypothetical protein
MKLPFKKIALSLAAIATVSSAAESAFAQDVPAAIGKDSNYGYIFGDDPLGAGGVNPMNSNIIARKGPIRSTLIRPRTSFVPEMIKSVENM